MLLLPAVVIYFASLLDSLFVNNQMDLREVRILKVFKNLFKEFSVSFELNPSYSFNQTDDLLNILHLTLGKSIGRYGDRVPGVWLNPVTQLLYISSAVNGKVEYSVDFQNVTPFSQWTNITIVQELVNESYWFSVYMNGTSQSRLQNTDVRKFYAVTVYACDPWHKKLAGFMRNLKILTGMNGKLFINFVNYRS